MKKNIIIIVIVICVILAIGVSIYFVLKNNDEKIQNEEQFDNLLEIENNHSNYYYYDNTDYYYNPNSEWYYPE